ncbi:MAG: hypothetical protein ACFE8C_12300 [Promethearchaeota archaeon]
MVMLGKTNKIQIVCPICKTRDIIGIPPSRLNKKSQLTTISVYKGLLCPHHFQFFIDKNFQIRGYQKVDLELKKENSKNLKNGIKAFNLPEKVTNDLFERLIFNGNEVKYHPLNNYQNTKGISIKQEDFIVSKKMTSREIYEEFWEFIDENNEYFLDFIIKDERRTKHSLNSKTSECFTV